MEKGGRRDEISWQLVSYADRSPTALQRHVTSKFGTNFSGTDRQTDRQADRQTGRQAGRQAGRQILKTVP
jgi:hypothetical protein